MELYTKIELVNIDKLYPYHNNPKTHPPEQIDKLCSSIKNYGFTVPIIIDGDNEIIAGHGRYKAAKKLDMKELPCIQRDDLTPEQIKAFRIADNKVAESEWDMERLEVEFEAIEDEFTGFELDELEFEGDGEVEEDDFAEEVDEEAETITELGDVIELGRHRLVCGDSTKDKLVTKLLNGNEIDLIFTDPPYGIDVVGNISNRTGSVGGASEITFDKGSIGKGVIAKEGMYKPVKGDNEDYDPTHLFKWCDDLIIWGANYFPDKLPHRGQWIVWDKNRPQGTTFSDCELAWTSNKGIAIKKYKCTWNGMTREGESGKRVHPTQKPLKVNGDILKDFSEDGNIILDLFGGSGSTLIAAEQLDRKCYMMELDEHYCDVIIRRYINYRQKENQSVEIKVNGEQIGYSEYLIE